MIQQKKMSKLLEGLNHRGLRWKIKGKSLITLNRNISVNIAAAMLINTSDQDEPGTTASVQNNSLT